MPARSGPLRAPSNAGSVHRAGRDRRGRQTGRTKRWRQQPFSRGADRPAPRHGAARPRQPKVMRFRRFRALCAELFAAAEARPAAGAGVSGATVPAGSGRRGSTAARSAGRRHRPRQPDELAVPSRQWRRRARRRAGHFAGRGWLSQTCSGSISPSLAVLAVVLRCRSALRPAISSVFAALAGEQRPQPAACWRAGCQRTGPSCRR